MFGFLSQNNKNLDNFLDFHQSTKIAKKNVNIENPGSSTPLSKEGISIICPCPIIGTCTPKRYVPQKQHVIVKSLGLLVHFSSHVLMTDSFFFFSLPSGFHSCFALLRLAWKDLDQAGIMYII